MIPFISHDDLGAYLEQSFTGGELLVKIALDGACEAVRQELHRVLNLVTDEDIVMDGNTTGTLMLPERPVHEVSNVTIDGEAVDSADYYLDVERGTLTLLNGGSWCGAVPKGSIALRYTHGYALDEVDVDGTIVRVPSNIRLVALRLAGAVYRSKGADSSGGAVTGETIGSYSYTKDVAAATDLASMFITATERVMLSGQRDVFAA